MSQVLSCDQQWWQVCYMYFTNEEIRTQRSSVLSPSAAARTPFECKALLFSLKRGHLPWWYCYCQIHWSFSNPPANLPDPSTGTVETDLCRIYGDCHLSTSVIKAFLDEMGMDINEQSLSIILYCEGLWTPVWDAQKKGPQVVVDVPMSIERGSGYIHLMYFSPLIICREFIHFIYNFADLWLFFVIMHATVSHDSLFCPPSSHNILIFLFLLLITIYFKQLFL